MTSELHVPVSFQSNIRNRITNTEPKFSQISVFFFHNIHITFILKCCPNSKYILSLSELCLQPLIHTPENYYYYFPLHMTTFFCAGTKQRNQDIAKVQEKAVASCMSCCWRNHSGWRDATLTCTPSMNAFKLFVWTITKEMYRWECEFLPFVPWVWRFLFC